MLRDSRLGATVVTHPPASPICDSVCSCS